MTIQQLYVHCDSIQQDTTMVLFETYVEYMMDGFTIYHDTFDDMPWELATADVRRFRIDEDGTLYAWVEVDE